MVNFAVCTVVWFIAVTAAFVLHILKDRVPDVLWASTALVWAFLAAFGLTLFSVKECLISAFVVFVLWLVLIFVNLNMPGGVMKGLITGALFMGRYAALNVFLWSVFLFVTLFFTMIFNVEDEKHDGVAVLVISSFLTFVLMYVFLF